MSAHGSWQKISLLFFHLHGPRVPTVSLGCFSFVKCRGLKLSNRPPVEPPKLLRNASRRHGNALSTPHIRRRLRKSTQLFLFAVIGKHSAHDRSHSHAERADTFIQNVFGNACRFTSVMRYIRPAIRQAMPRQILEYLVFVKQQDFKATKITGADVHRTNGSMHCQIFQRPKIKQKALRSIRSCNSNFWPVPFWFPTIW